MGISIAFHSTKPCDKDILERLSAWFLEDDLTEMMNDPKREGNQLAVQLYSGGEAVFFSTLPDGVLSVEASTTPYGPGYHQHVCDVLRKIERELGITWHAKGEEAWGDGTGYYDSNDRSVLEEPFLRWARTIFSMALKQDDMPRPLLVSMAMSPKFSYPDPQTLLLTGFGPRSRAWVERAQQDDALARSFYPWWDEGRTARVYLNLATALMWTDVVWREAGSEEEALARNIALGALERALELDRSLEFPCREWLELLDLYGDVSEVLRAEVAHAAAKQTGPLIGYRRHPMTYMVGPILVTVGGEFAVVPGENDSVWMVSTRERNLRLSALSVGKSWLGRKKKPADVLGKDAEPGARVLAESIGPEVARRLIAHRSREGDAEFELAAGKIATSDMLIMTTATYDDPKDDAWALEVWNSIEVIGLGPLK